MREPGEQTIGEKGSDCGSRDSDEAGWPIEPYDDGDHRRDRESQRRDDASRYSGSPCCGGTTPKNEPEQSIGQEYENRADHRDSRDHKQGPSNPAKRPGSVTDVIERARNHTKHVDENGWRQEPENGCGAVLSGCYESVLPRIARRFVRVLVRSACGKLAFLRHNTVGESFNSVSIDDATGSKFAPG